MSNVKQEYEYIVGYLQHDFIEGVKRYAFEAVVEAIENDREAFNTQAFNQSIYTFSLKNREHLLDVDLQATKTNHPDIYNGIVFWLKGLENGVFNASYDESLDYENLTTLRAYADCVSKKSDVHRHHI